MSFENDENEQKDEYEFDWSVYGDHEQQSHSLEANDYVAIFIAAIQTIFLPLVILAIAMLGIGLIVGILF